MILLVHENAERVIRILQNEEEIATVGKDLNSEIIRLAKKYPEELILWCEEAFENRLNLSALGEIFHQDLIMCSFPIKNQYLPERLGYVDQWPFVNPDYKVTYPTWRMSTDIGGVKGKTLLVFESVVRINNDLGYNLNSIAKLGQQNGLFCYSEPRLLLDQHKEEKLNITAGFTELFRFVWQHYKWQWVFILIFCLWRYESKLPLGSFIMCFFNARYFGKNFQLLTGEVISGKNKDQENNSVDVVIPTLGRPEHLKQVLNDLKAQSHLPKRVIVVEQNPDPDSSSELKDLQENYPFEIVHHFIHFAGACNARNLALNEVTSAWVFFADDDIRIPPGLLKESLAELKRLGVDCLNINCKQPGQKTIFHKIKQWGSFGAGTCLVNSRYAGNTRFSAVFENGYGEDVDYGMQLRKKGCDIIYHPGLEFTHLKAPVGGFRNKEKKPWEKGSVEPKPSPTLMAYAKKYYSREQLLGFKVELFLRYYLKQEIKNPLTYIKTMRRRWQESEKWSKHLEENKRRPVNV
ncbi:hypothetical protein SAMN04488034_1049 [Salinimicrobium catena]|uniref:Glycosyltransferase 2-like domain-containing protein n=1 Tax=Salinimicrobium catena TaxID=390640 RepID=A0A1H5N9Y8_9FLAO|nr:glycosyltransferase family 2 protein [Salinimicrobium catena]SDL40932.1 hypothetical protein SAMN04488140_1049 [Salinimicrobium catena]SEE98462.1 hypothetical protein SAMN04488034_1049 [Salinimicrobium catena]